MTCEYCTTSSRPCVCELVPPARKPRPQGGHAGLGLLYFFLLFLSIRLAFSSYLIGSYGASTFQFLYAAVVWKVGMRHIDAMLLRVFR